MMQFFVTYVVRRPGYVEPDLSVPELKQRCFDAACEVWAFLAKGGFKQVAFETRKTMDPALKPKREYFPLDESYRTA